jgi:hypothetical protein
MGSRKGEVKRAGVFVVTRKPKTKESKINQGIAKHAQNSNQPTDADQANHNQHARKEPRQTEGPKQGKSKSNR